MSGRKASARKPREDGESAQDELIRKYVSATVELGSRRREIEELRLRLATSEREAARARGWIERIRAGLWSTVGMIDEFMATYREDKAKAER